MKFKTLSIILIGMLMTSCSTNTEDAKEETSSVEQETSEDSTKEGIYPITVEHAFGETVIEDKVEKVTTIAWGNGDVALALGVVPEGMAKANWGEIDENGLSPWTADKLEQLGGEMPVIFDETDGVDFEAVSATNPDVILASYSGLTQEDYDLLSEIAPVVAYPDKAWQTYWREQITLDAKGMGLEEEGNKLVADLEQLIAEKTSEHSDLKDKTAVFAWFNPADLSKFSVYLPTDPRAAYLTDLGFKFSDSVNKLVEDKTMFYTDISSEYVESLSDVDVIVTYGDDKTLEMLQNDPLLSTIPAIKKGSVVVLKDGTSVAGAATPSALSIPYVIDEYLDLLDEAINKDNE